MRTFPIQPKTIAALAVLIAIGSAVPLAAGEEACGQFGTTLTFAESPAVAARQALKEEKLVFVLHVSGNFEESQFT
jgi:hypothetical protein